MNVMLLSVSVWSGAEAATGEAKKFQDWLDSVGGHAEPLPEGSFKGKDSFRQTGVNVHLVVIEK